MRTELFEEFVTWAESKTITAAAHELHISQSTLSKHLMALENEVGFNLVNRQGKCRLTPAGVRFYNGIVDVVDRLNKTVEECKRIDQRAEKEIAVWDPFVFSGGMRELERFMRGFAQASSTPFHFALRNEAHKTASEALSEGFVDVTLDYRLSGEKPQVPQEVNEYFLMEDSIALWCSRSHPLASKERLRVRDLEGVPIMLSMELAHPLKDVISERCVREGFRPRFYRFNPVSQASFFFDAPPECVYLFTSGLKNDDRIRQRGDMVLRAFDEDGFVVECYALVRKGVCNDALAEFNVYLSEEATAEHRVARGA